MYPTRSQAEALFNQYVSDEESTWVQHSRKVAVCAYQIADLCKGLDEEKAYVCGLLHDIGRGIDAGAQFRHLILGFQLMLSRGYEEVAKICFTHSFPNQQLADYSGQMDVKPAEAKAAEKLLAIMQYDDYDRLIQLCDALCVGGKAVTLTERRTDIMSRYGGYQPGKAEKLNELLQYFEEKSGYNLYRLLGIE